MDPRVTPSEDVPVVVVLSSLVTLCALVVTTVWMCWRIRRGIISQSEESIEFTLPEDTSPTHTPQTRSTEPPQDDPPPDGEDEEEEPEEPNDDQTDDS